ncbi:MAG: response regulator [Candidatus Aureabacteria bacterium]|nr:response regulator [Candidatus Auribacterota bacterium]
MEISVFLQKPETVSLRLSYLENVLKKHKIILDLLNQLMSEIITSEKKQQMVRDIFAEMHRLKGSGGTFGFNEISLIYKELLQYIRPAYEKKEIPPPSDLAAGKKIAEEFSGYLPILLKGFHQLKSPSGGLSSYSLLILNEDRRLVITELEKACINRKWIIYTVLNLQEARSLPQGFYPHIFILDPRLPDGNGILFCRELKKKYPAIPIIVISPEYNQEEKKESQKTGANEYSAPPYDMNAIMNRLATYHTQGKPNEKKSSQ